ncbi:hypothetical protein QWY99_15725 [Flavobacterium branchiarum]|uniref:Uncharacterized protein n=1 Tax=Flavobacterium branchiarum TaxID=1114870 RepID=A0ABV5FLK9_9FLAO|nr:hypothetical protein [Flavobacterium branchiarum]MDN3674490.1 hypothetical protein [Flavobacterium branchiarum]
MSRIRIVGGTITKTTGGDHNIYTEGTITYTSGKTITETSDVGITYGDYVAPPEIKHPKIVELQFIDDKDTVLKQSSIKDFGGIRATDFFYGKKMKIKITTRDIKDGTKTNFKLKAESKSLNQEFIGLEKLNWNLEIKDNRCETDFFELNPLWYSEDLENYNYDTHKTEIKQEDLNSFHISGFLSIAFFNLPQKEERITPVASYLRNYEELVGVFHTDNSGKKDLIENYENKFIALNEEIAAIVANFSAFLHTPENRTIDQIKARVEQDAKSLWDAATKQVQAGHLDDRPLYWARNKMQVRLKRHFLFEKDIDFEKSIVKKGTELDKIIQLFEEKSRNYTGIDFSKAGSKKKVLITGFDPFLFNQFNHPNKEDYNILQSNPSGVVALALANDDRLGVFIQTMIVPVRYTDFDGSQDNAKGQGEGIIEKYIKPFISQVDMIITVSQYLADENVIDMFGTSRRRGINDNMDFIRENGLQALSTKEEWVQTTLPKTFANASGVKINWKFDDVLHPENTIPEKEQVLKEGSGGNYLSNEIFYRVGKMRSEIKPTLATGHFHIEKLQNERVKEDLNDDKINNLLSLVKEAIKEGTK